MAIVQYPVELIKEYAHLDNITKNYKMSQETLDEYLDTLERIRIIRGKMV